jgi:hypothetical protein
MSYRVKVTSASVPRLRHTGKTYLKVAPQEIARALGAGHIERLTAGGGSPHGLHAIRADIARRLLSTGGRPSLAGTTKRQKIPFTPEDWTTLNRIAEELSEPNHRITAGQVASAIVHERLNRFESDE